MPPHASEYNVFVNHVRTLSKLVKLCLLDGRSFGSVIVIHDSMRPFDFLPPAQPSGAVGAHFQVAHLSLEIGRWEDHMDSRQGACIEYSSGAFSGECVLPK